jgi:hypothetical protein
MPLQCDPKQTFEAMLESGGKFDAAFLNEENKVGAFSLAEDLLIIFVVCGASAATDLYQETMSVDLISPKCRFHGVSPARANGAQFSRMLGLAFYAPELASSRSRLTSWAVRLAKQCHSMAMSPHAHLIS